MRYIVWSQNTLLLFLTPGCVATSTLLRFANQCRDILIPGDAEQGGTAQDTKEKVTLASESVPALWLTKYMNLKSHLTPGLSLPDPHQPCYIGRCHLIIRKTSFQHREAGMVSWYRGHRSRPPGVQIPTPPGSPWLSRFWVISASPSPKHVKKWRSTCWVSVLNRYQWLKNPWMHSRLRTMGNKNKYVILVAIKVPFL